MAWVLKGNLRGPAGANGAAGPSGAPGVVQSVEAGTNVTVDSTDPANPIVSASGGSGSGIVETIVGTVNQIDVNSTDPANPLLTLSAAVLAALALAATALQPAAIGVSVQAYSAKLAAYAGGDTPSAFTLGIVDSVDAAAWRAAIGAGTSTVTPAALTKTDDTNVTLTLGGTPASALLQAASLTLGWTGTLAVARGGSGAGTLTGYVKGNGTAAFTASATIPYSDLTGTPSIPTAANPTGTIGLTAVNGAAATYMRSDGAPALSQAITPTWTNVHTFSSVPVVPNDSWAYAKIQNVSATSRVLGRITSGAGDIEELTAANLVTIIGSGGIVGANPSATIGLSAVNGSATSYLRSDGAPALSQAIVPTWTGAHTFTAATTTHNRASGSINTTWTDGTVVSSYYSAGASTTANLGTTSNHILNILQNDVARLSFAASGANATFSLPVNINASTAQMILNGATAGASYVDWKTASTTYGYVGSGTAVTGSANGIAMGGINRVQLATGASASTVRLDINNTNATMYLPTVIGGLLTVASGASQQVWLQNDGAYIGYYNTAGTVRRGYLQMSTGGPVTLSSEESGQALNFSTNGGTINMDSPLQVTNTSNPQIQASSASGSTYLSAARASQTTGEVGVRLVGGTSGITWYIYQPSSADRLQLYSNGASRVNFEASANPFSTYSTGLTGNNYWQWLNSAGSVKGYIGYGSSGSDTLYLNNQLSAGIEIYTNNTLRASINAGSGGLIMTDSSNPHIGVARSGVTSYFEALSGVVRIYGTTGVATELHANASTNILSVGTTAGVLNLNSFPVRGAPRRTSGFANGEVLAVSAGVTLNTSDLVAGYIFNVYNDSASAITLTQGAGVTMRLVGTATSGSRTLAARGMAMIWANSGTEAICVGVT